MQAVKALVTPPVYARLIGQQIMRIGYYSLPVVALTSFSRAAPGNPDLLWRQSVQFRSNCIEHCALGITRELGPVLGGLMVAGRVSAAIAAEIGTMRVTEQIDADNPVDRPVQISGSTARHCRNLVHACAGAGCRHYRCNGRLCCRHTILGFNAAIYVQQTVNFLQPMT